MRISRLVLNEVACFDHLELTFPAGSDTTKADVHVLVGENGTGKSTILRALAMAFESDVTGLARRMRTAGAVAEVHFEPRGLAQLKPAGTLVARRLKGLDVLAGDPTEYAAFAYDGHRTVDAYRVPGVVMPSGDALAGAATLGRPRDSTELVQWIVSTRARAALANESENVSEAQRLRGSLTRLEQAIAEVTGKPVRLAYVDHPDFEVHLEYAGRRTPLDLLPDGLKSLLSWIGDLLMRMVRVRWADDLPVVDRPFALLLDEVELHLHPAWQRRVLPMVQTLFPKAQIFVATHSPFVVASADDAKIHVLKLDEQGRGYAMDPLPSRIGQSHEAVLREVFGVTEQFDVDSQQKLDAFYSLIDQVLRGEVGLTDLEGAGRPLAERSTELSSIVHHELAMVRRRLSKKAAAS